MVLVANMSSSDNTYACPSSASGIQAHDSSVTDTSDILMTPKLLENGNDSETGAPLVYNGASSIDLKPIQQAVILSQCLLIEKSSRHDEMQSKNVWLYRKAQIFDVMNLKFLVLSLHLENI